MPRHAEIAVRFKLSVAGAAYDFGAKFGAEPAEAAALLAEVAALGFRPALTFHVGTQNTAPGGLAALPGRGGADRRGGGRGAGAGQCRRRLSGGARRRRDRSGARISRRSRRGAAAFPQRPELVCEPGRGLVADAFAYGVEVKSVRGERVYLADGIYGGLSEFVSFPLPRVRVVAPGGRMRAGAPRPRILFGPTCDSLDRVPGAVALPGDLAEGDWLLFDGMGAYLTGVTTAFNGYGARETVIVDRLSPAARPIGSGQCRRGR